jgi:hypothetical protein
MSETIKIPLDFISGISQSSWKLFDPQYVYLQISSFIPQPYLNLLLFTIGMVFYALFVWFFYKNLAKRDIFKLNLQKYNLPGERHATLKKAGSVFLYILEYGITFPIYTFFWFSVFSLFLFILAKNISVEHIIMISIVFVSTIRVTSYYREELSNDLAKLIPFCLLAVMITDPLFFSAEILTERLTKIVELKIQIMQFMIFTILLEWILRILYLFKQWVSPKPNISES